MSAEKFKGVGPIDQSHLQSVRLDDLLSCSDDSLCCELAPVDSLTIVRIDAFLQLDIEADESILSRNDHY